jgi:flagellar biogenesis protein FliO
MGSFLLKMSAATRLQKPGGLANWLLGRLHRDPRPRPRLAVLERITLAPRQSVALIEAEGRRLLIATSADGAPAFYALDERTSSRRRAVAPSRVSW